MAQLFYAVAITEYVTVLACESTASAISNVLSTHIKRYINLKKNCVLTEALELNQQIQQQSSTGMFELPPGTLSRSSGVTGITSMQVDSVITATATSNMDSRPVNMLRTGEIPATHEHHPVDQQALNNAILNKLNRSRSNSLSDNQPQQPISASSFLQMAVEEMRNLQRNTSVDQSQPQPQPQLNQSYENTSPGPGKASSVFNQSGGDMTSPYQTKPDIKQEEDPASLSTPQKELIQLLSSIQEPMPVPTSNTDQKQVSLRANVHIPVGGSSVAQLT